MEPSDNLDRKIDTYLESRVVESPEEFTKKTVFKAKYEPISFVDEGGFPWKLVVGLVIGVAIVGLGAAYFFLK